MLPVAQKEIQFERREWWSSAPLILHSRKEEIAFWSCHHVIRAAWHSAFDHRVSDHLCAAWSDLQYKTGTCTFFLHLTHLFVFKMSTFRTTYQRNKGGVWRRGDRTDPLRDWKSHGWLRQDHQSRYYRTKDGQRHQATQGQIWSYGNLLYFNIYRLHVCSISKNVLCTFPQLDPSIYESLQKERVEVGDVIYIEANSGAVKVFLNQTSLQRWKSKIYGLSQLFTCHRGFLKVVFFHL